MSFFTDAIAVTADQRNQDGSPRVLVWALDGFKRLVCVKALVAITDSDVRSIEAADRWECAIRWIVQEPYATQPNDPERVLAALKSPGCHDLRR